MRVCVCACVRVCVCARLCMHVRLLLTTPRTRAHTLSCAHIRMRGVLRLLPAHVHTHATLPGAAELEDDKKLLLESFASPDGSFELSALSVLMSVEDCFLLKFKKKNKVTSIELMKIWQHYDEDNDGTIEQIELQGLLRDLLTAAATQSEGGSGSVVSPTDVREYSEVLLDMFDTDHDGKISIGELSKILNTEKSYLEHLKGRSSLTKEQFNRVWKHYDRDGTGLISGPALRALAWDVIRGEGAEAVEVIRLNEILEREAAIIEVAEIGESQGLNKLNLTTLLGLNPELAT